MNEFLAILFGGPTEIKIKKKIYIQEIYFHRSIRCPDICTIKSNLN